MLRDELELALSTKGERAATKFLKEHPEVVVSKFCMTGGHSKYVLNEFPLGSRFRADFVVPFSYSGVWEVNFVELENTDDMVITKEGKPSQRLNSAISQINDWSDYIERNRVSVQKDLSDWCMKKDLLKWHQDEQPPSNDTSDYLHDPEIYIDFKFHIIIGRRDNISKEKRRKMNQYSKNTIIKVGTYDCFIDIAKNYDRHYRNPYESVILTETHD